MIRLPVLNEKENERQVLIRIYLDKIDIIKGFNPTWTSKLGIAASISMRDGDYLVGGIDINTGLDRSSIDSYSIHTRLKPIRRGWFNIDQLPTKGTRAQMNDRKVMKGLKRFWREFSQHPELDWKTHPGIELIPYRYNEFANSNL